MHRLPVVFPRAKWRAMPLSPLHAQLLWTVQSPTPSVRNRAQRALDFLKRSGQEVSNLCACTADTFCMYRDECLTKKQDVGERWVDDSRDLPRHTRSTLYRRRSTQDKRQTDAHTAQETDDRQHRQRQAKADKTRQDKTRQDTRTLRPPPICLCALQVMFMWTCVCVCVCVCVSVRLLLCLHKTMTSAESIKSSKTSCPKKTNSCPKKTNSCPNSQKS